MWLRLGRAGVLLYLQARQGKLDLESMSRNSMHRAFGMRRSDARDMSRADSLARE